MIVNISEINNDITIIDFIPAPNQIIIIGPSATFGRLFNNVKYGSIILYIVLLNQRIVAINIPNIDEIEKLIITS